MAVVRLRVTHVVNCPNGDQSIHFLLNGDDGSGSARHVRFKNCSEQLAGNLNDLEVDDIQLSEWRSRHQGTLDLGDFLLDQMSVLHRPTPK